MYDVAIHGGDLVAWVNGLDPDERAVITPPAHLGIEGEAIHVRCGLTDILVKPAGVVDGELVWEAQIHTHTDVTTSRRCYQANVRKNRRIAAEMATDPHQAAMRATAASLGMPQELIDRILPMSSTEDVPTEVNEDIMEQFRRTLAELPEAPTSGGPTGFYM